MPACMVGNTVYRLPLTDSVTQGSSLHTQWTKPAGNEEIAVRHGLGLTVRLQRPCPLTLTLTLHVT
jgi:hypothetical protein